MIRRWVPIGFTPTDRPVSHNGNGVSIVTFNVLAERLAGEFVAVHPEALSREHRFTTLVAEMCSYGADVMCLQELDFRPALDKALADKGYRLAVFKPKTGGDGCAIYIREERVREIKSSTFTYGLRSSQVSVIASLQMRHEPFTKFVVGCTHLKAKQDFAQVRAMQTLQFKLQIQLAAKQLRDAGCPSVPAFACGDWNATRDEAAYTHMTSCPAKLPPELHMHDAYATYLPDQPWCTTYKRRDEKVSRRISDYVFYNGAKVTHVIELPTNPEHLFPRFCPSPEYPSDHLVTGAVFEFHQLDTTL